MNNSTQTDKEQATLVELNDQDLTGVTGAFGRWGVCCGIDLDLDDRCYGEFHRRFHFHHRHHREWGGWDSCDIC